jgi:hypothetical protein
MLRNVFFSSIQAVKEILRVEVFLLNFIHVSSTKFLNILLRHKLKTIKNSLISNFRISSCKIYLSHNLD